jgi:cytochrome d ubiquinol oxidase subunit I
MNHVAAFQISALWPHLVALYGALLLPLVAGLPPLIAIIESVYVMTGREIWRQSARFWGRSFGIALLLWAIGTLVLVLLYLADANRFTRYIHDVPRPALIAFFILIVFVGGGVLWRWFNAWWGLGRVRHLLVTWSWVLLSSLAVLKVAIGFGLLDSPAGVDFDVGSLQLWIYDLPMLLLNPAAQSRFVHLMASCYLTAATLVLSVSAWYLLGRRNVSIARRSLTVAASFGLAAALSLGILGSHRGYAESLGQQMRIAAIAAEWHAQAEPAAFTVFGLPDMRRRTTHVAVKIPWALGLGVTHSWRKPVASLDELEAWTAVRIHDGVATLRTMDTPWTNPAGVGGQVPDLEDEPNLGYGLLLLRRIENPAHASKELIAATARATIPDVPLLFWTFRGMALLGLYAMALFGYAFWLASKRQLHRQRFLRLAAWSLPVPWLAGALGWVVSEAGRGPWLVDGILPVTEVRASGAELGMAVAAWATMGILAVSGAVLITRLVRLGPDGLNLWSADAGAKRTL